VAVIHVRPDNTLDISVCRARELALPPYFPGLACRPQFAGALADHSRSARWKIAKRKNTISFWHGNEI
jgi:hypothetical protein